MSSKVTAKKVCVIGAGNSGLGAAKTFKSHGHEVTVIERSHDLGGVWERSRSYPDVQTQSPRELYEYSDFPMSKDYPEWPKGEQVHEYFTNYAKQFELLPLIRFNSRVTAMEHMGDGKGWTLQIERDGATTSETFDFVAVCTGMFSDPNRLSHPGNETFTEQGGQIMHSSEYTDPTVVNGKRVVVLGFSKSATDIAVNAVKSGAKSVSIVYLEPVWRIPYFFGNVLNFKNILYSRMAESLFKPWDSGWLGNLVYKVAAPFIWLNWRSLEALLNLQFGLKKNNMMPAKPIEAEISCSLPIATPDFFKMVSDGRITGHQGTIDRYEPESVHLTNGEKLPADLVIMAVGWKRGLPFLPETYHQKLVEADGQYRLYRVIVNPDLPDMGFVGFNSSFASTLTGEISANWLVRYMDGQLANQPTAAMMNEEIEQMLAWRRHDKPIMGVYGGLCVAPYHFRHLDQLMQDMGAKTHRSNPLAAQFAPLSPAAYERLLSTAPAYQAAA